MRADIVNVHPLVNTATIGMPPEELIRFLEDVAATSRTSIELGAL